jgi:5-(carboxyamino)imidazole ribonucleotide synthase
MENVLGEHVEPLLAWLRGPDAASGPSGSVSPKVHLYGKQDARTGRKMGHVNVLAARVEDALAWVSQAPIWR